MKCKGRAGQSSARRRWARRRRRARSGAPCLPMRRSPELPFKCEQNGLRLHAFETDGEIVRRISEGRIVGGKIFVTDAQRHVGIQLETQSGKRLPGKPRIAFIAIHRAEVVSEAVGVEI